MVEIISMKKLKIGVITTSSPINKLGIEMIKSGYAYLEARGFEVFEHPSCKLQIGYMAGTVEERVAAVHDLVKDPTVDIIMAFWGGDNTNQLLDGLDYDLIKNNPKMFIGYSDTSSLLNAVHVKSGLTTYLGPAVITFCKPDIFLESVLYLETALKKEGTVQTLELPPLYAKDSYYKRDDNKRIKEKNDGWKILKNGSISGKQIVAGCLPILQSLLATPYEPVFKDKVLFCEIDESINVQTLDRIIVQFRQAGILDAVAAFVFSKTTDESNITEKDLISILEENIRTDIPVIYNFDCGHTDPIITLPIGGLCSVDANSDSVSIVVTY